MKSKSWREIFYEMFSEPNKQHISLILVLTATAFVYASVMEAVEFCYTHNFALGEYLKEVTVLLAPVMTIYTTEKLGRKYLNPENPRSEDSNKN